MMFPNQYVPLIICILFVLCTEKDLLVRVTKSIHNRLKKYMIDVGNVDNFNI